jgi:hypothetical protein
MSPSNRRLMVLILAGLPVYAWFHAEQRRTKALAREGGSL